MTCDEIVSRKDLTVKDGDLISMCLQFIRKAALIKLLSFKPYYLSTWIIIFFRGYKCFENTNVTFNNIE